MRAIERVARAIHEEQRVGEGVMFDSLSPVDQERYLITASAALMAAKSPSMKIIWDNWDRFAHPCWSEDVMTGFNAIIDSIINEDNT